MNRGFTLVELMLVVSVTATVAAATGLLYLEVRTSAMQVESQVKLERRAALIVAHLARDLRGGALALDCRVRDARRPTCIQRSGSGDRVVYRIDDGALARTQAGRRRVLARYVEALAVADAPGGSTIDLTLVRDLVRGRRVTVRRRAFVGHRR